MIQYKIDDAFDVDAPLIKNTSVRDYQHFSYSLTDSNANNSRIELRFDDTSKYFLPSEGFIEVEGKLSSDADGGNIANISTANIGFVNNGIMALFSSAQYMIGTTKIESIDGDVDVATTILGLARYSDDFIKSAGHSMMFASDTTDAANCIEFPVQAVKGHPDGTPNVSGVRNADFNYGFAERKKMLDANGRFSCAIPLSHIFGFCRDIRKVIYGASHTVILQRKGSVASALWRTGGAGAPADGFVKLSKIALWMPMLTPSLSVETRLLSFMDQGGRSLLSWMDTTTVTTTHTSTGSFTWQLALAKNVSAPRHVFVALQAKNRSEGANLQERSHMIFDKCGVSEVSLRVSNQQEPVENLIIDYGNNQIGRVYHRLWSFMGRDQNIDTGLQISQLDFKNLYPIYYFSLQHLDLSKHSVVDVKFQARIGEVPAGGIRAIAVLLSDKSMILEGGGGRMRVVDAPVETL